MKKMSLTDPENTQWANIAKESFNFGLLAAKRFENGGTEAKKVILKTIGSYPKLRDKKLQYKAKYLFFTYKEGIKKTKEKIDSLVPNNIVSDQSNLENYLKNSLWCPREELNLHALRHSLLKTACIPISPPGLYQFSLSDHVPDHF